MPKIAVIILNWNNAELTLNCAASVVSACESVEAEPLSARLIVVDNASGAKDQKRLRSAIGDLSLSGMPLELETSTHNLGFAGGMNTGIRKVMDWSPDYIWLLNNDTVVDPQSITALLNFSTSHPQCALLGSTMADRESGAVLTAGGYRYFRWLGWHRPCFSGEPVESMALSTATPKLDYIDGAALWLRGGFIRRIGEIPDERFLYFEELSLNQCLSRGESIAWCPDALVYHLQSGSAPTLELQARSCYHAAFSAFSYTRQHHPICLPTVILARLLGVGFKSVAQRQLGLIQAVLVALGDFMMGKGACYHEQ